MPTISSLFVGDSSEDLLDEGKDALLSEDEIADFIVEEVEKTEPAAPSRCGFCCLVVMWMFSLCVLFPT